MQTQNIKTAKFASGEINLRLLWKNHLGERTNILKNTYLHTQHTQYGRNITAVCSHSWVQFNLYAWLDSIFLINRQIA